MLNALWCTELLPTDTRLRPCTADVSSRRRHISLLLHAHVCSIPCWPGMSVCACVNAASSRCGREAVMARAPCEACMLKLMCQLVVTASSSASLATDGWQPSAGGQEQELHAAQH